MGRNGEEQNPQSLMYLILVLVPQTGKRYSHFSNHELGRHNPVDPENS